MPIDTVTREFVEKNVKFRVANLKSDVTEINTFLAQRKDVQISELLKKLERIKENIDSIIFIVIESKDEDIARQA